MTNKTHWKKLINPNYLGSYSLTPGQDMILTIDRVVREKVVGTGGKKEECSVCYFKEDSKPMILNRLNQKVITKIYATPYIEDWEGKKIQLFSEIVDAFGEQVEALRIRPFAPKIEKAALMEGTPAFEQATKYLQEGGTIEAIEGKYILTTPVKTKLNEYLKK